MHTCLKAVDNLFETSGWVVNKDKDSEFPRTYYKKHFELDRFEIKSFNDRNMTYKAVIPLENASYSLSVDRDLLYDYLYDHLHVSINRGN